MKTYFLSLLFIILLPLPGQAFLGGLLGHFTGGNDSCPGSVDGNHMVVSFEGLGNTGVSKANLSNAFESTLHYTAMNLPAEIDSPNSLSKAYNCVMEQKKRNPNMKVSIIGHSCGGVTAVNLAQQLSNSGITIDNVLTVDPRCRHSLYTCADNLSGAAFNRPARVKQFVNFYQCGGGLAGQRVAGACNNKISSSHVFMPGNAQVRKTAYAMLSGQQINSATCSATEDAPLESANADSVNDDHVTNASAFAPARAERAPIRGKRDLGNYGARTGVYLCQGMGRTYECSKEEINRQDNAIDH